MEQEDYIFREINRISIPNFFITVEISGNMNVRPSGIETFLHAKYQAILKGISGRKFIYCEDGLRLIFTFFPTDRVVDERYALKNKLLMKKR
ncbi:hypothetical protein [Bacteroides reticulotermitis]|uniref:Uncharacterized protein n=2 Tax=Bacteroides reticulotermitis TaxID=1133319 RepID=W4UUM3_9BACE|nr:hypothetical protein [Bacteroides reticulotermitis]MBB4043157.1 hypothetical protein [Bacteroides reticulotermitis]GAE84323.1 hypothetical protein JCM10512_2657 [Bacteroides reticulotermitis JCM 10512]